MVSRQTNSKATTLVIRPLREEHVGPCAAIVAGIPLWQRYGMTLPKARRLIRGALAGGRGEAGGAPAAGEFAVATQGGRVVGLVWFFKKAAFGRSGYVKWLGVAPEARGRGVGRSLLEHAERRIFRSCADIFLLASEFNRSAHAFYARQGYERVGAIADYVAQGITELVFRKRAGGSPPGGVGRAGRDYGREIKGGGRR